jgi:hypothetical protein
MRWRDFVAAATVWEDGHKVLDNAFHHPRASTPAVIFSCVLMVAGIYFFAWLIDSKYQNKPEA